MTYREYLTKFIGRKGKLEYELGGVCYKIHYSENRNDKGRENCSIMELHDDFFVMETDRRVIKIDESETTLIYTIPLSMLVIIDGVLNA